VVLEVGSDKVAFFVVLHVNAPNLVEFGFALLDVLAEHHAAEADAEHIN